MSLYHGVDCTVRKSFFPLGRQPTSLSNYKHDFSLKMFQKLNKKHLQELYKEVQENTFYCDFAWKDAKISAISENSKSIMWTHNSIVWTSVSQKFGLVYSPKIFCPYHHLVKTTCWNNIPPLPKKKAFCIDNWNMIWVVFQENVFPDIL